MQRLARPAATTDLAAWLTRRSGPPWSGPCRRRRRRRARPSRVGVDDDLATGETGVAVGATDGEAAGGLRWKMVLASRRRRGSPS